MLNFTTQILSIFLGLLFTSQALAFPMPNANFRPQAASRSLSLDYNFEGIVSLSNCSGSLIRFENSVSSDTAMILTNGHCLESGFTEPNEVINYEPNARRFNILNPQGQAIGKVSATAIIYATMTKTDISIYRLRETFADIERDFNVRPLTLASSHPQKQQAIEIISGYWKHGYSCLIENFIHELKEAQWSFSDSIRFSQPGCETIGGTSGSPLVLKGTRTVIGINNTGNESGENCTMNNPCEIDADGKMSSNKGVSYGQQTYWIYSCLNGKNELDLKTAGCQLPM